MRSILGMSSLSSNGFSMISRVQRRGVLLQIARRGEQDDRDVLVELLQRARELPAVHHRHHEVEDDHVGTERAQDDEGLAAVRRWHDLEALVRERCEQQLTKIGVVVDDEDPFPSHQQPIRVPQKRSVDGQASRSAVVYPA